MRDILFPFQEDALVKLHSRIRNAHNAWALDNPQVISFSAPTGAGKTVIITALFEDILYGSADCDAEPDSIFIWLSDSPALNAQSRMKIESKSDKIPVRDLITIDSTFNAEYLEPGHIYFLNTQKLGTDKLLTSTGDAHSHTIWQTITNTAQRQPKQFYIIIDEAHRGTNISDRTENKAQSIMQKFIKGSPEDGLCIMPLVIGISATPQRFEALLAGTDSAVQKVAVPPNDVRESGLLKDRVIIHYPDMALGADMTMFKQAIQNWQEKCRHWAAYCDMQGDCDVRPILVVQVDDGGDREVTKTDLNSCVDILQDTLGRTMVPGEVVHTFHDYGVITVRNLEIQPIEPERIEENSQVKVVFFKMNLSTGWDCPRAETMLSFRSANDFTFIAQLLGRMIRTPLARRIQSDAELNNVGLFLPYFDEKTVTDVIKALNESEAVTPSETGTNRNLITLRRDLAYADVFSSMRNLVTYNVDSARKQPALKQLVALSRALGNDDIDGQVQRQTLWSILDVMDQQVARLRADGTYEAKREKITGFGMDAVIYEVGGNTYSYDEDTQEVSVTQHDIDRQFEQAGKHLGEGLHRQYWRRHADRNSIDVKTELIVMVDDATAMETLEQFAKDRFDAIWEEHRFDIADLTDSRRTWYKRLAHASVTPIAEQWQLPDTIDFSVSDDSRPFEQHMYITEDGGFKATLNPWEAGVVEEELTNGAVCWLRNVDRKQWALGIPYKVDGVTTTMYPDIIIVRAVAHGYVFDILEPHDESRKDNYPKAVGLAEFADQHMDVFGRIQLIRKKKGADGVDHFYRLDMANNQVRTRVKAIHSNSELDHIFDDLSRRED